VNGKIDAIRTAIAARLATVPEIGVVHARERYAGQSAALKALYEWPNPAAGKKTLRGWWVDFRRLSKTKRVGRVSAAAVWEICGLIDFDDQDDTALAINLALAAAEALEADPTLGGVINRLGRPEDGDEGTVFVGAVELVGFAGVVCHRARLTLTTEHFE
jgi:hypothetical protein